MFLLVIWSNIWWGYSSFIRCLSIFLHLTWYSWTKIISTINTYFVMMVIILNLAYFFERNTSFFHVIKRITIKVILFHTAIFFRGFNFFALIFLFRRLNFIWLFIFICTSWLIVKLFLMVWFINFILNFKKITFIKLIRIFKNFMSICYTFLNLISLVINFINLISFSRSWWRDIILFISSVSQIRIRSRLLDDFVTRNISRQ